MIKRPMIYYNRNINVQSINVASHQKTHYTWNCNARRTSTYYDTDTQLPSLGSSKPCYE